MRLASVWLKFGTRIGDLKAKKFEINLNKIQGFISDYMHKVKSNFCHSFRVNCFKEQPKNQYVARLNISRVPFWWLKIDQVRDDRDILSLTQPWYKVHDRFCAIKKIKCFHQTAKRNELKISMKVESLGACDLGILTFLPSYLLFYR